ncbi:ASCH domain-containing protein [Myxococcota bacterium]
MRWESDLLSDLGTAFKNLPAWAENVQRGMRGSGWRVHLGIFSEPYLGHILAGRKTVESRFSRVAMAPYERASVGDILVLKRSSGPIVGACQVHKARFVQIEKRSQLQALRHRFATALCATDPEFWRQRADSKFVTLLKIRHVIALPPIGCDKKDRRGWVTLDDTGQKASLWQTRPL